MPTQHAIAVPTLVAPAPSIAPARQRSGPTDIARIMALAVVTVGLTAWLLFVWWPAGVAVGLLVGTIATVATGLRMQRAADAEPHDGRLPFADA